MLLRLTDLLPDLPGLPDLPDTHGIWIRGSQSGALDLGLFLHMLRRIKVLWRV